MAEQKNLYLLCLLLCFSPTKTAFLKTKSLGMFSPFEVRFQASSSAEKGGSLFPDKKKRYILNVLWKGPGLWGRGGRCLGIKTPKKKLKKRKDPKAKAMGKGLNPISSPEKTNSPVEDSSFQSSSKPRHLYHSFLWYSYRYNTLKLSS